MDYRNTTIQEFINITAGKDPVPGGGSISALAATLAAALGEMVTGLTIGRKKYVDVQQEMQEAAQTFHAAADTLLDAIAQDAQAYDTVFSAYKLPKETDQEKEIRNQAIQKALLHAANVPLQVAQQALDIMPLIKTMAEKGNQNAITDSCVAMMCARTAVLGALLNCRINLADITDAQTVHDLTLRCNSIQQQAQTIESQLLDNIKI